MDAFENLKNSQSNFDKLTKQIEATSILRKQLNQKTNTKTTDCET